MDPPVQHDFPDVTGAWALIFFYENKKNLK